MDRSQIQVQGTNDSSIVSKLSMVEKGYFADPFIKHFVKKPSRRSPLINRCYHARATSISYCLKRFLSDIPGAKQIISLGAGFDTSYFRMKQELTTGLKYIEVDFPDVMNRKIALAKNAGLLNEEDLLELQTERELDMLIYASSDYIALGFDLRYVGERLNSLLKAVGVSFDEPTLILSEVVLSYLPSEKSSSVIEWAAKAFTNAVFIVFEQVTPDDSFGNVMCKHFKQIGGPLLSIDAYPTITSHIERHKSFGLVTCNAIRLNQFYYDCIDTHERKRVEELEIFDEFEAWHRACQHYFILCSTNTKNSEVHSFCEQLFPQDDCIRNAVTYPPIERLSIQKMDRPGLKETIQRYGHCACVAAGRQIGLIFGGFGIACWESNGTATHRRLSNDLVVVDLKTLRTFPCQVTAEMLHKNEPLNFSMFATAVYVPKGTPKKGSAIIFGGRSSPAKCTNTLSVVDFGPSTDNKQCASTWWCNFRQIFHESDAEWPPKRWRHSAVVTETPGGQMYMIILGGKDCSKVFDDCWCFDMCKEQWSRITLSGDEIEARHSHSTCKRSGRYGDSIIVSGGLNERQIPYNDVFEIQLTFSECTTARVRRVSVESELLPRYSHTSHVIGDNLLLVGGVSFCGTHGDKEVTSDTIDVVNLRTGLWSQSCKIADDDGFPVMLHNHSSVIHDRRTQVDHASVEDLDLVILGGGDNCFSFGTWFNRTPIRLPLKRLIPNIKAS